MSQAFIFPGQASQKVGMGLELYQQTAIGRQYFDQANQILGADIKEITFNGPEDVLKQTRYTQPAIYIVSVILGQLLLEAGLQPAAVAGHSLGEYSALTIAGAFDFATGLELVKIRAESMQAAGEAAAGTMAAVMGLSDEAVDEVCRQASIQGVVIAANYNAPSQIVISGAVTAVRKAMELATAAGAIKVVELNVSGAFHSPLMAPAREKLAAKLATTPINDLTTPLYANVSALPITHDDEIRRSLIDQLENPVRWHRAITNMEAAGITNFIEVGPGRVLQGLLRRINRKFGAVGVESLADIENLKNV
ncbi:MAG: ACP S-malonyltransferase [Candidatus Neomarinimicrobiota bacterium]